ncbi:hypothetical protein DFS33DRAFT_1384786 [Desarmillaria ectypa]|nr:hypothetical protein DFS33DRAFT_1384786 [Desarmillaria ectypa]
MLVSGDCNVVRLQLPVELNSSVRPLESKHQCITLTSYRITANSFGVDRGSTSSVVYLPHVSRTKNIRNIITRRGLAFFNTGTESSDIADQPQTSSLTYDSEFWFYSFNSSSFRTRLLVWITAVKHDFVSSGSVSSLRLEPGSFELCTFVYVTPFMDRFAGGRPIGFHEDSDIYNTKCRSQVLDEVRFSGLVEDVYLLITVLYPIYRPKQISIILGRHFVYDR